MRAFTTLQGLVVPIDRANVDTDAIIPKQFLKSVRRSGFGPNLFDAWRYLDVGEPGKELATRQPNPDFVLNYPRYRGAQILLARENFGCGSSREHAVWALDDYGIRVLIAPSFADIFHNNCFKSGVLPIELAAETIDHLFIAVTAAEGYSLTIDLRNQYLLTPDGAQHGFQVDSFRKQCLLQGLDDIGLTLQHADQIKAYEAKRAPQTPWLFADIT